MVKKLNTAQRLYEYNVGEGLWKPTTSLKSVMDISSDYKKELACVPKRKVTNDAYLAKLYDKFRVAAFDEVEMDDFDQEQLIGLKNQVLEISPSGVVEVRPHSPDNLLTNKMEWMYDSKATAPKFERTIKNVLGSPEQIALYQKMLGLSLSSIPLHKYSALLWVYGAADKGKSTLLKVITEMAGPAFVCSAETTRLATVGTPDIIGKKVLTFDDMSLGSKAAFKPFEDMVNPLVTATSVGVKLLFKDPIEVVPTSTLIVTSNHLPKFTNVNTGFKRRCRILECVRTIPASERDDNLVETIVREENAGILNWALEGLQKWKDEGLGPVTSDEAELIREAEAGSGDHVTSFVKEYITESKGGRVPATEMYNAYINLMGLERMDKENRESKVITDIKTILSGSYDRSIAKVCDRSTRDFVGFKLKGAL